MSEVADIARKRLEVQTHRIGELLSQALPESIAFVFVLCDTGPGNELAYGATLDPDSTALVLRALLLKLEAASGEER